MYVVACVWKEPNQTHEAVCVKHLSKLFISNNLNFQIKWLQSSKNKLCVEFYWLDIERYTHTIHLKMLVTQFKWNK